jgi:hypothetical protein
MKKKPYLTIRFTWNKDNWHSEFSVDKKFADKLFSLNPLIIIAREIEYQYKHNKDKNKK